MRRASSGTTGGPTSPTGSGATTPATVRSAVALSVPHTRAVRANRPRDFEQLRRSFYIWLFVAGHLADSIVPAEDFAFIHGLWQEWSPGFQPDEAHLKEVVGAFARPDGLSSALGYYRALFDRGLQDPRFAELLRLVETGPVTAPTLLLMGERDGCIGPEMAAGAEVAFTGPYRAETLHGCGHFLHLERPEDVGARIVDWFARY